jgi:hypothetical protein
MRVDVAELFMFVRVAGLRPIVLIVDDALIGIVQAIEHF